MSHSFSQPPEAEIFLNPFFDSKHPTDVYIDFESNGIRYIYELSTTKKNVIREAIYKKISRKTLLVERKNDELKSRITELSDLDLITLRSNASIVDTALQYNLKGLGQDFQNIKSFFSKFRGNVSSMGVMEDSYVYDHYEISKYYNQNPKAFEFAKNIIRSCDLGISDIEIFKTENEKGEPRYFPMFLHPFDVNGARSGKLTYWDESDGTTALYRRLFQYWTVLTSGGVLIMDEFDTNYHPDLLPKILDLFINEHSNPKNAQFIFTSHNLEIMDYLGKYRTYLVSKENGESFCYRLDEIPGDIIRNDRSISGLYRDGKLGGVPNL